jgi:TetR/AcrR family transcriptional regulator, tetracycline repressor protein
MSSTTKRMRQSARSRNRVVGPDGRRPGGLNRDQVVQEAFVLLDRDGLDNFSLRGLANHLGVTPMALYNHVDSKRDLLQAVAEKLVTEAEYRPARGDWQQVVRGCFRTLREACLAHPGALRVVESADALPPAVFRPMEMVLKALHTAGLSQEDAVRGYFVLMTFTLGQVKYQIKGWSRGVDSIAAMSEGRIGASAFPAVVVATAGEKWDFNKFFEFGLSLIVEGLRAQAAATLVKRKHASGERGPRT